MVVAVVKALKCIADGNGLLFGNGGLGLSCDGCDDCELDGGTSRPLYRQYGFILGTRPVTPQWLRWQSPIDSVFIESEWVTNTEWVYTLSDESATMNV